MSADFPCYAPEQWVDTQGQPLWPAMAKVVPNAAAHHKNTYPIRPMGTTSSCQHFSRCEIRRYVQTGNLSAVRSEEGQHPARCGKGQQTTYTAWWATARASAAGYRLIKVDFEIEDTYGCRRKNRGSSEDGVPAAPAALHFRRSLYSVVATPTGRRGMEERR